MSHAIDKFWLWGHDAGSHDDQYDLPAKSRITPVEAAYYMGVPNVIQVRYSQASLAPTDQYIVPFRALDKVMCSLVGAGGVTIEAERERVLDLPRCLPNMTGVIMDDFFRDVTDPQKAGQLSPRQLDHICARLSEYERDLELWVVLYTHQLKLPVGEHLARCDRVTFWTWEAPQLERLEEHLAALEALAPSCGIVLGCYMWDYGLKRPMPVEAMRRQCEQGLAWLKSGRIGGMIFLATCICDLGLPAVESTRHWIREVGGEEV